MLVIIGPVEGVIRRALYAAWDASFELRASARCGLALIDEGLTLGATAVVTRRVDILDLCGQLPGDILVLGVSTGSWTVLACHGETMTQIPNPYPESLEAAIYRWVDGQTIGANSEDA